MIDEKIRDHTIMNGLSSFFRSVFLLICKISNSSKRLEHSDAIKCKGFVPFGVTFNEDEAVLLFSRLFIVSSRFIVCLLKSWRQIATRFTVNHQYV